MPTSAGDVNEPRADGFAGLHGLLDETAAYLESEVAQKAATRVPLPQRPNGLPFDLACDPSPA